ncbi:MAG: hypothetical protein CPSOU_4408 [uncultured Paraburkholderia sp.]|nr:MAG: hypothetical protein CPSOU_4408 [uncultured Paraburkholderia sp.]
MKMLARALFRLNIRNFLPMSSSRTRSRMPTCENCRGPEAQAAVGGAQPSVTSAPDAQQLERIAAYARCGYFHVEYLPGIFVAPFEISPR